jgi:hypothetical protein
MNFFDTVQDIEEQGENMVYTKPKWTSIVPFICEYILVKFVLGSKFMTVRQR